MTTTYTPNAKLQMPGLGDTGWSTPINANAAALDAITAIGALAVTPTEIPSATLNVAIAAGNYIAEGGTVDTYAGTTSYALAASSTLNLYLDLDNAGALTAATSWPSTPHIRLATVATGPTTITSITDARIPFAAAGTPTPGAPQPPPLGGLGVALHESPSTTLNVTVAAGSYRNQDGTVTAYAGDASYAIAASTTACLYLDLTNAGTLTAAAAWPATPHVRLAVVVSGATAITGITDARLAVENAGERLPVVTRLLSTTTAAPTATAGAGAGTSGSATAVGTDFAGAITVGTGTSPAAGALATITFNLPYASTPRAVLLTPLDGPSAALTPYVSAITTTSITIGTAATPAASTAYHWSFAVIG